MDNEMKQNNGIGMSMFDALKYSVHKNTSACADTIKSDYRVIYEKMYKNNPRELKKRLKWIESL